MSSPTAARFVAMQAACIQWSTEAPADTASGWLARAHDPVRPSAVGGYLNYVEAGTPLARYLGLNLDLFNTIRQTYDPGGVMRPGIA